MQKPVEDLSLLKTTSRLRGKVNFLCRHAVLKDGLGAVVDRMRQMENKTRQNKADTFKFSGSELNNINQESTTLN